MSCLVGIAWDLRRPVIFSSGLKGFSLFVLSLVRLMLFLWLIVRGVFSLLLDYAVGQIVVPIDIDHHTL